MRFDRYDRIASLYTANWPLLVPGYVPILNGMLDIVRARGERPREILDVGCGPACATAAVAAACDPAARVSLVDGSRAMIEAARHLMGPQVRGALIGDFTDEAVAQAAFAPTFYDLVLCSFALHHIDDAHKRIVVEHLGACLKPGGLLLLADEVTADRPASWDLVERVRARAIHENLAAGRIAAEFWRLETSLAADLALPFLPGRVDELTSLLARAGVAVSCPITIFGSALLVGVRPV